MPNRKIAIYGKGKNMTKEQYAETLKDIGETHKNGKYIA